VVVARPFEAALVVEGQARLDLPPLSFVASTWKL